MPPLDPNKPRPTRQQIVARVRQRLGPRASLQQIADVVADVEYALEPTTTPFVPQGPPAPTGIEQLGSIARAAGQPFAAEATQQRALPQGPMTGTGAVMAGVLEAIPQIAPGAIHFIKDAFLAAGQNIEAGARNVAGQALAPFGVNVPQSSREEQLALPRFAFETVKGLVEPVADVMALAAATASGHISEEERLAGLERAGFTLVNLLALEAGGRIYKGARSRLPAQIELATNELRQTLGREPTVREVREALRRKAPTIIAQEARSQPANGVQNPAEVGVRSGAQGPDALRALTDEQLAREPLGTTPPLAESAAAPGVMESQAVAATRRILERERRQESKPVDVERRRQPAVTTPGADEIRSYREGLIPPPTEIVRLPVEEIVADPARFQFKSLGSEGISAELRGVTKFNPQLAGVVSVWRDPANGKIYVVNGHHRLELARRLGQKKLNVQFLDAPDATMARAEGAFINIAEGRGTATDVAKFLRDRGATPADLEARGVTLRSDLVRDGLALSRLAPDVFDQVTTAKVPQNWGVAIGEILSEPVLQREALAAARGSGLRLSQAEVAEIARQVRDAGTEAITQESLFGTESVRRGLFVQKAQLAAAIQKRLAADKRLFGYVSQEARARELGRAGETRIDVGAARGLAQGSATALEIFNRLYTRSGPVADIVAEGARRIAHGEKPSAVAASIYPAVGDAVQRELGTRPDVAQSSVPEGVGPVATQTAEARALETRDFTQQSMFADGPPTPGQLGVQSTPDIRPAESLDALRQISERELGGPAPAPPRPAMTSTPGTTVEAQGPAREPPVLPRPEQIPPTVGRPPTVPLQGDLLGGEPLVRRPGETLQSLKEVSKQDVARARATEGERGSLTLGPRNAPPAYRSPNPEIEAFFEDTARPGSIPRRYWTTMWEGIRTRLQQFAKLRSTPRVPGTEQFDTFFADAREVLRQGIDAPRLANAEALTLLNRVTHKMSPADLDVFRRIVVSRDLVNTASRGLTLPRGLKLADFQAELPNLERIVRGSPVLQEALANHVQLMKTLTEELVRRGVLTREAANANPHYFPHQVLDFMEARLNKGTPGKIKRLWRSYAQQRHGSERDIYTDYLETLYSHLSRTLRDNKVDDILSRAAEAYDIGNRALPDRAAKLQAILVEYQNGTRKLAPEQRVPRTIRELSDEALAEAGYERFYPVSPRAHYQVRTLPEGAMVRIMEAIAADPELKAAAVFDTKMFGEAMAVGRGKALLLPTELADVLNNYRAEFFVEPSGFVAQMTRGWKQLVLNIKPLRYNRRNLLGDLERMSAAVPAAWRRLPRAVKDQLKNLQGEPGTETFTMPDGTVRSRYELASERSVIASGKTAVEVGRLREATAEFAHLLERGTLPEAIRHPLRFYSNIARKLSSVREDWARLAVFYHNLDRIAAGKPLDYGVSIRKVVDAIGDPIDRAAKISRDAMGDYGGLTKFENGLRNGVIPFYAWMRINSTFWPALIARQGFGSFARHGAWKGARAAAWLASRVAFVYAATMVWNNMVMGEQEDALPDYLRRQFHFNTGMQDENGRWITLTDPTALDDFLQTVGLDGASPELRQLFQCQLTFGEYLERRANDMVRGPAKAVLTALGPVVTVPLAGAGKQPFPDPFNPREIPPYERIPAMVQQLGVPAELLDVAETAVYNPDNIGTALTPDTRNLFDMLIPSPLGVQTTRPPEETALVREAMSRVFQLQAAIKDIERREQAILSGLSRPNATPQDREAEVEMLEARLEGLEVKLEKALRREAELRRRSAP